MSAITAAALPGLQVAPLRSTFALPSGHSLALATILLAALLVAVGVLTLLGGLSLAGVGLMRIAYGSWRIFLRPLLLALVLIAVIYAATGAFV